MEVEVVLEHLVVKIVENLVVKIIPLFQKDIERQYLEHAQVLDAVG